MNDEQVRPLDPRVPHDALALRMLDDYAEQDPPDLALACALVAATVTVRVKQGRHGTDIASMLPDLQAAIDALKLIMDLQATLELQNLGHGPRGGRR